MASSHVEKEVFSKFVWCSKSNLNPSCIELNDEEWNTYSDIENEIIEQAYQRNEEQVWIDDYLIDLKNELQINKIDESIQRSIRRIAFDRAKNELTRMKRFQSLSTSLKAFNDPIDNNDWSCPFIEKWIQEYTRNREGMDKIWSKFNNSKETWYNNVLEAAALGILKEGEAANKPCEAQWMADQLRSLANKEMKEICEFCFKLYTKDSFLFRTVNKALWEDNWQKTETLGPFCYILYQSFFQENDDDSLSLINLTLFRGASVEMIDAYEDAIGTGYKKWPGFTSATLSREVAALLGDTLFVISISRFTNNINNAYDIAHLSNFPDEQEVLLPAGVLFRVLKVIRASAIGINKNLILIELHTGIDYPSAIASNVQDSSDVNSVLSQYVELPRYTSVGARRPFDIQDNTYRPNKFKQQLGEVIVIIDDFRKALMDGLIKYFKETENNN